MTPALGLPRSAAPAFWQALCCRLLQATPRLATELWQAYRALAPQAATAVRYELERVVSPAPSALVAAQRMTRAQHVLPPGDLLAASARLSPEGHCRRRDVVQFETTLLRYVDRDGNWR